MTNLVLTALLLLLSLPVHAADITGKPRVIDGDTIEIAGQRIRLHGIDAPEAKQTCTDKEGKEWRCGQEATFALLYMIGDHWTDITQAILDGRQPEGLRLANIFGTIPRDWNAKRRAWSVAG